MKDLPRLILYSPSLNPCTVEGPNVVSFLNVGGASKGIRIVFSGTGFEKDDVVISNGILQTKNLASSVETEQPPFHLAPFALQKVNLSGEWVWEGMIPDFEIPDKVPGNLGPRKTDDESFDRSFSIRFDVSGDTRRFLDVRLNVSPLENPVGGSTWYCWLMHRSKRDYLEARIRDAQEAEAMWGIPSQAISLEDYDLTETLPPCQKPVWY